MFELNVFTIATGKYKRFVLPYITSVLWHNKNAFTEIWVDDPLMFTSKQRNFLNRYFPNRWDISKISTKFKNFKGSKAIKSIRFLARPFFKAKYTYIGDVDFIILDSRIAKVHAKHANFINKPYSNIVRPVSKKCTVRKMTGLHFVCTAPYYAEFKKNKAYINSVIERIENNPYRRKLDEELLYTLVQKLHGLPDYKELAKITPHAKARPAWNNAWVRPGHGLHTSPGRRPFGKPGWGIIPYNEAIKTFWKTEVWQQGLKVFGDAYHVYVLRKILDAQALAKKYKLMPATYVAWRKNNNKSLNKKERSLF